MSEQYNFDFVYERIKNAWTHAGMNNAADLAKEAGIKKSTISTWKHKKSIPDTEQLMKICNACDCDIDYLLGRITTFKRENNSVHEITGLSEASIDVLKKAATRTEVDKFLDAKSTKIELIDLFICECAEIAEHIERILLIDTAERAQHDIEELAAACEAIHAETEEPFERWLKFREHYIENHPDANPNDCPEYDNFIYNIYMLICNSHFVESERFAISREFNRIVNKYLDRKLCIWKPTSGFTASKDK